MRGSIYYSVLHSASLFQNIRRLWKKGIKDVFCFVRIKVWSTFTVLGYNYCHKIDLLVSYSKELMILLVLLFDHTNDILIEQLLIKALFWRNKLNTTYPSKQREYYRISSKFIQRAHRNLSMRWGGSVQIRGSTFSTTMWDRAWDALHIAVALRNPISIPNTLNIFFL